MIRIPWMLIRCRAVKDRRWVEFQLLNVFFIGYLQVNDMSCADGEPKSGISLTQDTIIFGV